MTRLDESYRAALETLSSALEDRSVRWAITGSTSFALQGVPVTPDDIDVQTTEDGAYEIAETFADRVIEPVSVSESASIRSHFGVLELEGIRVEVMGAVQKRRPDGAWEPPVDITDHRTFVDVGNRQVPVLSLRYEAEAYEKLGRSERANVLREHAEE